VCRIRIEGGVWIVRVVGLREVQQAEEGSAVRLLLLELLSRWLPRPSTMPDRIE